jgi:hypothetical protein
VKNAQEVVIGGYSAEDANTISGNYNDGVEVLDSAYIDIAHNFIGTNPAGTAAVPYPSDAGPSVQSIGVEVHGEVGGDITLSDNVISGNSTAGVDVHDGIKSASITSADEELTPQYSFEADLLNYSDANSTNYSGYYCFLSGNLIGTDGSGEATVAIPADVPYTTTPVKPADVFKGGAFAYPNDFAMDPTRPFMGVLINSAAAIAVGIPGATPNVISGDNIGVLIGNYDSLGGMVANNVIGLDGKATMAIPDAIGIDVNGSVAASGPSSGAGLNDPLDYSLQVLGNVISGNTWAGVELSGPGASWVHIHGNFIGTNAKGAATASNWVGIYLLDAPNNLIGGTTPTDRNQISDNTLAGIYIVGAGSTGNVVWNNAIGTTLSGKRGSGNDGYGVLLYGTSGNTIGKYTGFASSKLDSNGNFSNMISLQYYLHYTVPSNYVVPIGVVKGKAQPLLQKNSVAGSGIADLRSIPGPVAIPDNTIAELPPSLSQVILGKSATPAVSKPSSTPSTAGSPVPAPAPPSTRPRKSAFTAVKSPAVTQQNGVKG